MERLFEMMPSCVALVDRTGRVVFANLALREKCGEALSPEGASVSELAACFPGTEGADLVPPEEVFGRGRPVSRTLEHRSAEGWRRVLEISALPLMGEGGRVDRAAVMVEDITERSRVEQMLERYAEGLTVLHELSTIFLTTAGMGDAMHTATAHIADYYGADFCQVLLAAGDGELELVAGAGGEDIMSPGDRITPSEDCLSGYALKERSPALVTDFASDPVFRPHETLEDSGIRSGICVPLLAGDRAVGVLCLLYRRPGAIDTAELWYLNVVANSLAVYLEKERSRETAERSEAHLRSVMEGIGEGVVVVDRDLRIISTNSSYVRHHGLEPDDITGRYCYTVSHQQEQPCGESGEDCPVRKVFETGRHYSVLHAHPGTDGMIYAQVTAYPLRDATGSIVAAVETVTDVTGRVQLEKDLEKRVRELEEFYEMAVGRELRMIELKDEIVELTEELRRLKSS